MGYAEITFELAKSLLPERPKDSNKGTFGKVLNVAGCSDYQGAAYLSSVSSLKVGAGLVTLASTSRVVDNLASAAPWITFLTLRDYYGKSIGNDVYDEIKDVIDNYTVVSVGSGLSVTPAVIEFMESFVIHLNQSKKKTVIDADGINALAQLKIPKLSENSVITPHPMELSRLIGVPIKTIQEDRIKYACLTTERFGCTTVLKGSGTVVCTKDLEVFVNTSGNSALAKAGSGDVLTGIISGFIAQGLSVKDASRLGVYLHGLCGELASNDLTEYCVLATDLIDYIPNAMKILIGG